MGTAKPRRIKFSEEEKFLILEEFRLRRDILIPRSGRYKNTPPRQRAWQEIAAAVNSLSPLVQRSPDEIRKKWENMVADARRYLAVEKHPLCCQRPQEKLFRSILALFDKPGPGLPDPLLSAFGARTASSPPRMLEVTLDLSLHGQSSAATLGQGLLCLAGTPPDPNPSPGSILGAADGEPDSKESLLLVGPTAGAEKRLTCPSTAPTAPNLPVAEMLPAAAPRPTSQLGWGSAGVAPVPPDSSPKVPAPFCIKCPPSPALVWPCLGTMASPEMQSPPVLENGSPLAPEGSQPSPRGCVGTAREQWEKQSWLQTEILQLQKEKILLEKEKILLEKEKILLEIIKLRRELGT